MSKPQQAVLDIAVCAGWYMKWLPVHPSGAGEHWSSSLWFCRGCLLCDSISFGFLHSHLLHKNNNKNKNKNKNKHKNHSSLWIWAVTRLRAQHPAQPISSDSQGTGRGPVAVTLKSRVGTHPDKCAYINRFFFHLFFPWWQSATYWAELEVIFWIAEGKFPSWSNSYVFCADQRFSSCLMHLKAQKNEWKKSYSSELVDNEMMIGEIMPWLYCQHNVSKGNSIEKVHFEILIPLKETEKPPKRGRCLGVLLFL